MNDEKYAFLSPTVRAEIDHWLTKYPPEQKRSALLPALHIVQDANGGWLAPELIEAVAHYLGLPPVAAYEVATFYSMYDLQPVGRHKVRVCTSISCMLRGADELLRHMENHLAIKVGETTPDGRITLKKAECLAACGGAPAVMIDRDYHENITHEKANELLDNLK
ncbi:MAG: NADH-quinone oxidoreductase subunit NuoE [Alphaproteobacteria bacterium]|nr:NADH-quinone oxidoreductase subunit NuoE [Alphaproteobacteria bacterium]